MNYNLQSLKDLYIPESVNNFLNYMYTIRGKSINTINGYKFDLVMFFRFLKLYYGYCPPNIDFDLIVINDVDKHFLKKITLQDVYSFLSFAENQRNNGSYARARKVAALKSFFKYICSKERLIDENPSSELESPKINKRNPIYLSLEESRNLLGSISGSNKERDYCIIILFLNCGMRLSELCSIRISKIKGDTLSIIGKGNKERTVYLNDVCIKAIKDYTVVRDKKLKDVSEELKDYLFLSNKKTNLSKRAVERLVKKYVYKAGLNSIKYTPHKLRHTAATLMYKYGKVDIRTLQLILGHESVATTQIYTHVDDESLREAVGLNPLNK